MKNLFPLLILTLLPIVASADAAVEINGIRYQLNFETKQAEVISNRNTSYTGRIIIPAAVAYDGMEYSVTSIGVGAFKDCYHLTSVTIPESVTRIWGGAFENCYDLASVNIPNSVKSIETETFKNCSSLTSITIPNSVSSIGNFAFSGCSGLTFVTIPNSVTNIGDDAFYGCHSLTSITIPNSVTNIGVGAFSGTLWLDNQPDGCVYAGKVLYTYKGEMPDNTEITIKDGTLGIGEQAFRDCYGLTCITIPNSLIIIEDNAFLNCNGLTSVTIPNSVASIGYQAFCGCSGLVSVTIGNGVTNIGNYAFYNCSGLSSVKVESTKPVPISSATFTNRSNVTLYVPLGCKEAYEAAQYWKDFKEIVEIYTPRCATPTIAYEDGKLTFECETEGATCHYCITDGNSNTGTGNEVSLSTKYLVTVYATKEGFKDSEVVSEEITIGGGLKGDMNGDGVVDLTDAIIVVYMSLGADM